VRRRSRVADAVERASVARTLQAIEAAHVVVMVLDAHEGIAEQDASVLGLALQRGRALLLAINKWDGIPMDRRDQVRNELALRLDFVPFAPQHFISARHGTGVGELASAAIRAFDASMREMPTSQLSRVLEKALEAHQPPLVRGRRIKLRYAHQGGRNPPRIVIHGNQTQQTPDSYKRYLSNVFREAFDLYACPVALELRTDANPFGNREQREAAIRKVAAKKKGGQKNVARRVPRKKVASGKPGRRPKP
jgi:GTP-binding protein